MVAAPTPTQARPETRVFRVEELIAHARAGRIRVPSFQHGFRWTREDVQKLIDSIWRGYPIGALDSAVLPHVLENHDISAEATRALQENDGIRLLELHRDRIEAATARLVDRHAEWDHSDRPSIASLIDQED
jgi:hypothetical protein